VATKKHFGFEGAPILDWWFKNPEVRLDLACFLLCWNAESLRVDYKMNYKIQSTSLVVRSWPFFFKSFITVPATMALNSDNRAGPISS
jgi:hypothetical protein